MNENPKEYQKLRDDPKVISNMVSEITLIREWIEGGTLSDDLDSGEATAAAVTPDPHVECHGLEIVDADVELEIRRARREKLAGIDGQYRLAVAALIAESLFAFAAVLEADDIALRSAVDEASARLVNDVIAVPRTLFVR